MIYSDNSENETTTSAEMPSLIASIAAQRVLGNPLYYSVGDKVYYPGKIDQVQWYRGAVNAFQVYEPGVTSYDPSGDGAILITFQPGFDFIPPKGDLSLTGYDTLGYLDLSTLNYEAIVQEINVKRKKKRILN
jgi:hypothetical protein